MVYALQVDRIEREALALVGMGATWQGQPLTVSVALDNFDAMLLEEPKRVDPDQLELMRALGVA